MKLFKGIAIVIVIASLLAIIVLASMVLGEMIDFKTSIKNMIPFVIIYVVSLGTYVVIDDAKI